MGNTIRIGRLTLIGYLTAPFLAFGTAAILLALQNFAHPANKNGYDLFYLLAYLLPIIIATLLGGRMCGLTSMLYASPCAVYFLIAPHPGWKPGEYAICVELVLAVMAGVVVTFGVDSFRIKRHLPGQSRDRTDRESLAGVLLDQTTATSSVRPRVALHSSESKGNINLRGSYREELLAVTGGRLTLCEMDELSAMTGGEPDCHRVLRCYEDVTDLRHDLMKRLTCPTLRDMRLDDICLCVTEAAANAVKHGGGGAADVWFGENDVRVLISDSGPGISSSDLARATLEAGYSTIDSLGMGFTMMMETADSVALCTSPEGTRLLLHVGARIRLSLADKLQGYGSESTFRQRHAA